MGVINITPNSFSDPHLFYLNDSLRNIIAANTGRPHFLFDFGFESTAPMNPSVSAAVEQERFDQFFELIKDLDLSGRWISFDTYRPESFRYFESRFKGRYKAQGFLFNDVSGVLDAELQELLEERKNDPAFRYVYSYTHIPSRAETGNHMNYLLKEGDRGLVLERASEHFKKGEDLFKKLGVLEQVVFDPSFGFSKTYEQNWDLIRRFPELKIRFRDEQSWLIGLSKKSFLRKSLPQDIQDDPVKLFAGAEVLHERLLTQLMEENRGHLFYRVHDFDIVSRAENNFKGPHHA